MRKVGALQEEYCHLIRTYTALAMEYGGAQQRTLSLQEHLHTVSVNTDVLENQCLVAETQISELTRQVRTVLVYAQ